MANVPPQLPHHNHPIRAHGDCPPSFQFYTCRLNGFEGCCSMNPCSTTDGCPPSYQVGANVGDDGTITSTSFSTITTSYKDIPDEPSETQMTTYDLSAPNAPGTTTGADAASVTSATATATATATTSATSNPATPPGIGGSSPLASGSLVGVVVSSVAVGLLVCLALLALFCLSRRRKKKLSQEASQEKLGRGRGDDFEKDDEAGLTRNGNGNGNESGMENGLSMSVSERDKEEGEGGTGTGTGTGIGIGAGSRGGGGTLAKGKGRAGGYDGVVDDLFAEFGGRAESPEFNPLSPVELVSPLSPFPSVGTTSSSRDPFIRHKTRGSGSIPCDPSPVSPLDSNNTGNSSSASNTNTNFSLPFASPSSPEAQARAQVPYLNQFRAELHSDCVPVELQAGSSLPSGSSANARTASRGSIPSGLHPDLLTPGYQDPLRADLNATPDEVVKNKNAMSWQDL